MGTFGRLVFCEVKTQIVGKTKFFDSLKHAFGVLFFFLPYYDEVGTGRTGLPQQAA